MSNDNGQKSILEQIFERMIIILENKEEFNNDLINKLKDSIEKNLFNNQKEIIDALKG